jgi:hypothetical protein
VAAGKVCGIDEKAVSHHSSVFSRESSVMSRQS